jgi:hypothetical protein
MEALKRLTTDGWHGDQCIFGGSEVTWSKRAIRTSRKVGCAGGAAGFAPKKEQIHA